MFPKIGIIYTASKCMTVLTRSSLQQPWEVSTLIPILQTRKQKHREGERLVQDHTASEWWDLDLDPGILAPEPSLLASMPCCLLENGIWAW